MSKPGVAKPDPKLSSHHCEQSDLQVSEERLDPPLGSLTGQNIPSEHRASMEVSTEQRKPGSRGPRGCRDLGLGLSSRVQDSESCELVDPGRKNSKVQSSSGRRSMDTSGSLSGMDSRPT